MLKRMQLFPLNFYKKEKFNGSIGGMNFRLAKAEKKQGDKESMYILRGTVWKGPYCYDVTPESKKEHRDFSFTEEGIQEAMVWFEGKGKEYNFT